MLRLVLIIIFFWPFESFVSAVLLCLSSDGIDGLGSVEKVGVAPDPK